MRLGNGFVRQPSLKGGAAVRVVMPRGRCMAMAAAAFLLGGGAGLAGTLLWSQHRIEQSAQRASDALALAAMYLEDLVRAQDVVAGLPAEGVAAGADPKEAQPSQSASGGARQEQAVATNAQPKPGHSGAAGDHDKQPRVEVVRMTLEQAAIKTLSSGMLTFRSGAIYRVGERLPSGALLLAVDAASGRIVTDRRIIALVDWAGAAKSSVAMAPASTQGWAGASKDAPLQGGHSGSGAPASQSSSQTNEAAAAATKPVQASAQAPSAAASAPESEAATTVGQSPAAATVAPGSIEVVSAQQANVAALQSNGVRFLSGRFVAVGETFPSGEKLLRVLPAQGRIITDRRIIQIKEAQAND